MQVPYKLSSATGMRIQLFQSSSFAGRIAGFVDYFFLCCCDVADYFPAYSVCFTMDWDRLSGGRDSTSSQMESWGRHTKH